MLNIVARACEVNASIFVGKFYVAFNNVVNVLSTERDEMTVLHPVKSYCLSLLLCSL